MKSLEKRVAELERILRGPGLTRHATPIVCLVYDDAAQTLNNDSLTPINFAHDLYDEFSLHNTVTNNTRVYFPASGWYIIDAQIGFASNATGGRAITFRISGVDYVASHTQPAESGKVTSVHLTKVYYAIAEQYVEVYARQNCGTTLDTYISSPQAPTLGIVRIA